MNFGDFFVYPFLHLSCDRVIIKLVNDFTVYFILISFIGCYFIFDFIKLSQCLILIGVNCSCVLPSIRVKLFFHWFFTVYSLRVNLFHLFDCALRAYLTFSHELYDNVFDVCETFLDSDDGIDKRYWDIIPFISINLIMYKEPGKPHIFVI